MNNTSESYNETWAIFLEKVFVTFPYWTKIVYITAICVIFIVSLFGNLITCIVIYCDKTMHTVTNYYLFNMAVTDLIVTFAILIEVDEYLSKSYQFGDIACKIHFFSIVLLWNNSILVMTALAIERYVAICYPMRFKSKVKRVMKVMTGIWIIAIIETLPEIWSVELIKSEKVSVCFTVPTPYARIINGLIALVTFIFPLAIMIFVYTMISFKINTSEKTNSNQTVFNHKDNRGKVNKLIAVLTLSFLTCWLPFFTFRAVVFIYDMNELTHFVEFWRISFQVTLITNWLSVVLNPIIFSLISTKFRRAFKMLWKNKFVKQNSKEIRFKNTMTNV